MDSAHFIKFCRETDISYTEDNRGGMKNTILGIDQYTAIHDTIQCKIYK